jgi:hypothetical protein
VTPSSSSLSCRPWRRRRRCRCWPQHLFCFMSSGPRSAVETVPTILGSWEAPSSFQIGLRFGSCVQSRESVMSSAGRASDLARSTRHSSSSADCQLASGRVAAPPFCTQTLKRFVPPRGPRSGAASYVRLGSRAVEAHVLPQCQRGEVGRRATTGILCWGHLLHSAPLAALGERLVGGHL